MSGTDRGADFRDDAAESQTNSFREFWREGDVENQIPPGYKNPAFYMFTGLGLATVVMLIALAIKTVIPEPAWPVQALVELGALLGVAGFAMFGVCNLYLGYEELRRHFNIVEEDPKYGGLLGKERERDE